MDYSDNMTEPDRPEMSDRLAPRVKGLGLVGSERSVSPLQQAFSRNEQTISELEMTIENLEQKLSPVSTDMARAEKDSNMASPRAGSSPVTRSLEEQTDRLGRSIQRIRRITEDLEV